MGRRTGWLRTNKWGDWWIHDLSHTLNNALFNVREILGNRRKTAVLSVDHSNSTADSRCYRSLVYGAFWRDWAWDWVAVGEEVVEEDFWRLDGKGGLLGVSLQTMTKAVHLYVNSPSRFSMGCIWISTKASPPTFLASFRIAVIGLPKYIFPIQCLG